MLWHNHHLWKSVPHHWFIAVNYFLEDVDDGNKEEEDDDNVDYLLLLDLSQCFKKTFSLKSLSILQFLLNWHQFDTIWTFFAISA